MYGPNTRTIAQVLLDKGVITSSEAVSLQLVEYEYSTRLLTVGNQRVWKRILEAESDEDRDAASKTTVQILQTAGRQIERLRASRDRLGIAKATIVRNVVRSWLAGIAPVMAEHLSTEQRKMIKDAAMATLFEAPRI